LVFASAAARNAAITSPQEGQFAFTKDTNGLWYYDGAAWVASGATGDIEGVTAGVGITGGGTSGTVTITNDMATTITASGDIVIGTGNGTYDNLPIGTTNQVLTADTTVSPYKVKWATPAGGGGKVLQVVTANYGTAVSNSTGTYADTGLTATITPATTGSRILVMVTHADSYRTGSTSGLVLNIMRGSTEVWNNGTSGDQTDYGTGNTVVFSTAFSYLDSPSTTSATTYKTQLKNSAAIASVRTNFNSSAGTSQIILMEIGA